MTDTIKLASEQESAAIAASNLATSPEEKPLENGEIKSTEGEEPETEEIETPEDQEEEIENKEVEGKDSEPKPKKKGGFQKKIDRLTTTVSKVEQERDYWRQEALRTKPSQPENKVEATPDLSKRPKADDFKTADEYTEALAEWKANEIITKREAKTQQDRVKTEVQKKFAEHGERVDEFKKTNPDFEDDWKDAVQKVGEQNLSLTVREVIVTSDMGPEVMQALADDPKEFKRICGLSALEAAKALGKIEVRLSKPTTPSKETKKTITQTPKPPTPVRTKGAGTAKGFRPEMTQREYEDWRKEQSKGKGA